MGETVRRAKAEGNNVHNAWHPHGAEIIQNVNTRKIITFCSQHFETNKIYIYVDRQK